MGLKWRRLSWPWCNGDFVFGGSGGGDGRKRPPKTVNIFMGYFFMVNICLGVGFLGIPYSFFYSGYLAAIPSLILIGLVSWLNSVWLLEVMARAQGLESMEKSRRPTSESDTTDSELDDQKLSSNFIMDRQQRPEFEITLKRKFEPVELCEIFVGKWFKYVYLVVVVVYCFLASWSFATVAGTAWATNIPYNFGALNICDGSAFQHRVLPQGGCLYSYYFSIFLFGIIVVTLSLLDLKEQALVQFFLGSLRFITVGIIVVYAIVRLVQEGNVCEKIAHGLDPNLFTNFSMHIVSFRDIVVKFDPRGWLTAVPVFTYAFLLHLGIPSLTHPVKQKKYLHWLLTAMFLSAFVCYMSLGLVVPLWLKATVQETVTLNWGEFIGPENSVALRGLSYYLILFPSLDVMSAYPLNTHCGVNNLYTIVTGRDTSKKPKWKYDWLLRFFLRLVAAVLPLLAAFGVANLIYVLKYAGLFGFFICFFFPTILQLRSMYVCTKKFAGVHVSLSGSHTKSHHDGGRSPSPEPKGALGDHGINQEMSPLLSMQELEGKDKRSLYMTPYSNVVLSHPVFVSIVGLVGVALFVLAAVGLFVEPHKITCAMREEL